MVKWCNAKELVNLCALASLKAFCNKLMTVSTQNDMNIKKLILLHKNGEELCICKYKPTSWQHFKENSPSTSQLHDSNGILVEGQSINR